MREICAGCKLLLTEQFFLRRQCRLPYRKVILDSFTKVLMLLKIEIQLRVEIGCVCAPAGSAARQRPYVSCSAQLGKLQNMDSIREPQVFCFRDAFLGVLLEFFPIGDTVFQNLKFLPNVECAWDIILSYFCPELFTQAFKLLMFLSLRPTSFQVTRKRTVLTTGFLFNGLKTWMK